MKFRIIPLVLLVLSQMGSVLAKTHKYNPLIAVVIMVKDEGPVIKKTLQTYCDAGITSFFVFDTGSTDKTIEKTKEFFAENNITNGHIGQEPFIDFAQSRNRALELAEEAFPNAGFFIMPDAEWYLHNGQKLIAICERDALLNEKSAPHSYLINITNPSLDFYTQRLFRCASHVRFVGAVHESPPVGTPHRIPRDCFFELSVSHYGAEKSQKRWTRDCDLLLNEHKKDPKNMRTMFYLAQTYDVLGEWENALEFYQKRVDAGGWQEEQYIAMHRVGKVIEKLMKINDSYTWDMALKYYMDAYSLRPSRAEPLIQIAKHYLKERNHPLAYLFVSRTMNIPYPVNDVLFVDKNLYALDRYDVMSQCAWYNNDFNGGEEAAQKAIKCQPNLPHLRRNLACYIARKSGKPSEAPAIA